MHQAVQLAAETNAAHARRTQGDLDRRLRLHRLQVSRLRPAWAEIGQLGAEFGELGGRIW